MWSDAIFQRDPEPGSSSCPQMGFVDRKGVAWSVVPRDMPERQGRIALEFSSANGKRRSSQIQAMQIEELQQLSDEAWRTMLSNAAVIELA